MNTVGHIVHGRTSAPRRSATPTAITFADASANVAYFEPAVLAAPTPAAVETGLKLWAKYSDAGRRPAGGRDPFPGRRGGRKNARAHQARQLPFPQRAAGRRHRPVSRAPGLAIIGFQGPPHERRAGDGFLRTGARSPPGQAPGLPTGKQARLGRRRARLQDFRRGGKATRRTARAV